METKTDSLNNTKDQLSLELAAKNIKFKNQLSDRCGTLVRHFIYKYYIYHFCKRRFEQTRNVRSSRFFFHRNIRLHIFSKIVSDHIVWY
jgi:hypothetical protein